jgi:hypothetical protein
MDENQNFQEAVQLSLRVDPMPTFRNLAEITGTRLEDVVHHALVRYASSGAEALLAVDPQMLKELIEARRVEDWPRVAALVDWLEAGLQPGVWRRG